MPKINYEINCIQILFESRKLSNIYKNFFRLQNQKTENAEYNICILVRNLYDLINNVCFSRT